MTLPAHIVDEIMGRLGEAQSQRTIAAELGVSRGTVQALATGRRSPTLARRPQSPGQNGPDRGSRPVRHTCGYLVYLPCQICLARKEREKACQEREETRQERKKTRQEPGMSTPGKQKGNQLAARDPPVDDLALDLPRDPETQRRYAEARASAQARQMRRSALTRTPGRIAEHPHVDPDAADRFYAALAEAEEETEDDDD